MENLAATISLKALRNDTLNVALRRLDFKEQSGFALDQLKVKIEANDKKLRISDLSLLLPNSSLRMDDLEIRSDSLTDMTQFPEGAVYQGRIESSVTPSDLSAFLPPLKGMDEPIAFSLDFEGHGTDILCPQIRLEDKEHLRLAAKLSLKDLDAGKNLFLDGNQDGELQMR